MVKIPIGCDDAGSMPEHIIKKLKHKTTLIDIFFCYAALERGFSPAVSMYCIGSANM